MVRTVKIVNGGSSYAKMFILNGWKVVNNLNEADLVQFTGGEDVTPSLYGAKPHPFTGNNVHRDEIEREIFLSCLDNNLAMAGICRGGQFLNVMCGGTLWQHVEGHTRNHITTLLATGEEFVVTSTHHQVIRPQESGEVLVESFNHPAKFDNSYEFSELPTRSVESVLYRDKRVLCYQPHPEFTATDHPCQTTYFKLVEELFK